MTAKRFLWVLAAQLMLHVIPQLGCMACDASAQAAGRVAEDSASQVPLADPYILLEDGVYYAYGTNAEDGIEVYVSADLRDWKLAGLALHRDRTSERRWFWAPEVYHRNGKYFMYYSANEHLFVATSDSPTGPFVQQGGYMMQSVLGDEKCIDSSVFFDEATGKTYMFFVRFNDGNCIWSCELADDLMTPVGGTLRKCINVSEPWEMRQARVAEGPFVVRHGGKYFLTYSANDYQSQDYAVGYAVADAADGAWTKSPLNPIVHRVAGLVGTGHHSLFTDKDGQWRIVFHAHRSKESVHPRLMYVGTMVWKDGGLQFDRNSVVRPRLQ